MAASCACAQAIWSPVVCAVVAMGAMPRTRSGDMTPHSSTRMPPMDAPTTSAQLSTPRASARAISALTWSRTVTNGKRPPQGRPSGAVDAGPVLP